MHLNKQRMIIKKMCAAGIVGILAANVATSLPAVGYTEKMGAEEYHASARDKDESSIQQVVVPVTPVTSNNVVSGTQSVSPNVSGENDEKGNMNGTGGDGEKENQNISSGNGTTGNPGSTGGNGTTGNPESTGGSGTTGNPGNPGESGIAGNPGSTDENGVSENPGGENGSGTTGNPGSTGGNESIENPGEIDGNGSTENSGDSDTSNQPNNPDKPDGSNQPENPDGEEDTDNPDQSGDPDGSEIVDGSNQSGDVSKPDNVGKPDNTQNPPISGKPNEPDIPDNQDKPYASGITKPSWPLDMKPGFGTNTNDGIIDIEQFKPETISPERIKNASLILNQKLVKLPQIVEDYRFWTVARKYAFAKENLVIRESIIPEEETNDKARIVGKLRKNGLLYILKEEEDGWLYVESGRVRGFVRSEEVITNEDAGQQLKIYQEKAKKRAERLKQEYKGIEGTAPMAREILPWQENEAYTYLRATVNQTVVEKKYALAKNEYVEVMEDKDEESRVIGVLPQGGLCFILEDEKEEWIYIESGDVRGFVKKNSIQFGEDVTEQVKEKQEDTFLLAEEKVKAEENEACYYTLTSTKPGVPSGEIRRSMVEFAAQFVGNPYVWGGTSLTEGADCSGFVQSIYKQYGYELPRVSRDQAQYGTKIPVEDALPGDLIFYANNGNVYHVVMYAGEGKTIEAMSTDMGIVQADVSKNSAVWATRILNDNGYAGGGISDVNATKDMYGKNLGTFKLTYYCACELCCNVETGITATGAPVVEGRTIAVDPRVIPYGTQVIIGGHVFTAEDCGGAIKENHIDIYVNDHEEALALGVNYADVYLKK